jgi:serine/threonine protein phosphatase PrpC
MVQFQSAVRASQGARRYQEDAALIWPIAPVAPGAKGPERLVTVLADGMGGHAGGATASRIACESFLASIAQSSDTGSDNREKLLGGLFAANAAIAARIAAVPALSGMGSTLVGALFGPLGLEWVSVGDSPLYLFRNNEIALLNEDHSLAPALDQMAAEGKLSFEQARNDPRRHLLRSAVTGEDVELIDVSRSPLRLEVGDYVVQASDGIHTLEPDEIARVISAYKDDGCESAAAALVRSVESMRDPHQDNITVIVVRPV